MSGEVKVLAGRQGMLFKKCQIKKLRPLREKSVFFTDDRVWCKHIVPMLLGESTEQTEIRVKREELGRLPPETRDRGPSQSAGRPRYGKHNAP